MRLLVVFLAVISVGACGGLAWTLAKPIPPDPRVAGLAEENRQLKHETGRLREQVGRLESAVVKAEERVAKTASEVGLKSPNQPSSAAPSVVELSASAKSLMDFNRIEEVDRVYGKLMERLGLNDKEKAHFRQLLIDRDKASMDAALRAAKAPQADRKRLSQEMTDQRKAFDETIKAFLNHKDDHELFKQWEDTKPERGSFERTGKPLFANSSEPLTDTQEEQLINLMAQARKKHGPVAYIPIVSKLDPAAADAKIVAWREQMIQIHADMRQEASALLTPAQLDIFSGYLGQHRDSVERSARMSARPR